MLTYTSSPLRPAPRSSRRHGAAVVEFAVLAPFLALMFFGAIDLSRAFYYSTTIDNCCWNAAMYGATGVLTDPTWNAAVPGTTTNSIIQAGLVDGTNLNPALTRANFSPAPNQNATDADGNPCVQVTITYNFKLILNFLGVNSITITRTAQVRVPPANPTSVTP